MVKKGNPARLVGQVVGVNHVWCGLHICTYHVFFPVYVSSLQYTLFAVCVTAPHSTRSSQYVYIGFIPVFSAVAHICTMSEAIYTYVILMCMYCRYSLTEKGLEMAERLLVSSTPANVITFQEDSSTSDDDHSSDVIPDQISPQRIPLHSMSINTDRFSQQNVHDASQSHNTVQSLWSPGSSHYGSSWKNTSPMGSVKTGLSSLGYCYIDPEGKCVREKDKAAVTFDGMRVVRVLWLHHQDLLCSSSIQPVIGIWDTVCIQFALPLGGIASS